jgi:hypothetical protein
MNASEAQGLRRRTLLLGVCFVLVVAAYIAVFIAANEAVLSREDRFASTASGGSPPLDVYFDVIAIDPVRESMEVRIDVATGPGIHGAQYYGRLNRDVELRVTDGESERDFRFRRNEPLSTPVFVAGLQGAVSHYPFDRYATSIAISAADLSAGRGRSAMPVRVTVWEGIPAWFVSVTTERPSNVGQELRLAFRVHRPAALVVFGCIMYGLMMLIGISAFVIGALSFSGVRRIEVTLVGALAAMVFALPILHNVLPGTPPLGVLADVWVFLWSEIAATIGLILFVTAWVQRGPRP